MGAGQIRVIGEVLKNPEKASETEWKCQRSTTDQDLTRRLLWEGDHLLYVKLPPEPAPNVIQAVATTSQWLTKASQRHVKTEAENPEYLQEFEDVVAKESFDALPIPKVWDHAIKLKPGSKPINCKVYPLFPAEKTELDAFL